jgi:hypothetical protein
MSPHLSLPTLPLNVDVVDVLLVGHIEVLLLPKGTTTAVELALPKAGLGEPRDVVGEVRAEPAASRSS